MKRGLMSCTLLAMSVAGGLQAGAVPIPNPWEKPAGALAEQISEIMGPGQAQLTIRNISSVPSGEIPAIRKTIEQDLKAHGIATSGSESANAIHVTLSENVRERLWVAEVVQGSETRVAMVELGPVAASPAKTDAQIVLRKERLGGLPVSDELILFAAQAGGDLVIVHTNDLAVGSLSSGAWKEQKRVAFGRRQTASRDPRGLVIVADDGASFRAYAPAIECSGTRSNATSGSGTSGEWAIHCSEGDDPWPVLGRESTNGQASLKAFFNAGRNYFTGVVAPSIGVDLPPFYSAGLLPRPGGGAGLLMSGIDGRVQMVDNGTLRAVAGTRDWGSDLAVVDSGCGAGAQVITSESGSTPNDRIRAYEILSLDAIGTSAPLSMDGAVTALWTPEDGKGVLAVVRNAANEYEVDRVTALCN